jgi:hypothetical protein
MAVVRIVDLAPGMTLDTDIVADEGRMLARAGTTLTAHHLQILRKWGIEEASVRGEVPDDSAPAGVTAETMAAVDSRLAALFQLANDDHPAIKELTALARARMLREMSGETRHAP